MKSRVYASLVAAIFAVLGVVSVVSAQKPDYRISVPYSHKNLTIFLIHGKDQGAQENRGDRY